MKSKLIKTLICSTMVLSMVLGSVTTAFADSSISQDIIVNRISGPDRYCTSTELNVTKSKNLIIVNGLNYADALSSSALAVKEEASIVLTNGTSIPYSLKYILDTYADADFDKIIIVGGTSAVSTNLENELKKYCNSTIRISGANRYETSYQVAKHIGNFDTVFVATGLNYADALSVSSIAAKTASPIILTNGSTLNTNAANLIKDKEVYILGGSSAVSSSLDSKFENSKRLSGSTRYETNKKIVNEFASVLTSDSAYVVTGTNFPDALAVSALAGKNSSALILTAATPSTTTKSIVSDLGVKELIAVGGQSVVSATTMQILAGRTTLTDSNGASSIAAIKNYAINSGFTKLDPSNPNEIYYRPANKQTMVGFIDNHTSSILEWGYAKTDNRLTVITSNPITNKNDFLPILKMALPNSYEKLYDLICSDKNLENQELYLDGKKIEVINSPSDVQLEIYYTNSTFKRE